MGRLDGPEPLDVAVVRQPHQVQQRRPCFRSELIPQGLGLGQEVQVVGLGVRGVEVARGAVGGTDVMTGLELLQQDHGLTAPGQLPRGGRSHCSSANNYDVHHASSIHPRPTIRFHSAPTRATRSQQMPF